MAEKEPLTTESAPVVPFEVFLLGELEAGLKTIAQESSPIDRDQKTFYLLTDILLSTAAEFIVDDPNEQNLPEEKIIKLPFGNIGVVAHKQSHADFFVKHFGATEFVPQQDRVLQSPKVKCDSYPYIGTQIKIFPTNKGRKVEICNILGEKGDIVDASVIKHVPVLRR